MSPRRHQVHAYRRSEENTNANTKTGMWKEGTREPPRLVIVYVADTPGNPGIETRFRATRDQLSLFPWNHNETEKKARTFARPTTRERSLRPKEYWMGRGNPREDSLHTLFVFLLFFYFCLGFESVYSRFNAARSCDSVARALNARSQQSSWRRTRSKPSVTRDYLSRETPAKET